MTFQRKVEAIAERKIEKAEKYAKEHPQEAAVGAAIISVALLILAREVRKAFGTNGFREKVFGLMPVWKETTRDITNKNGEVIGQKTTKSKQYPSIQYKFLNLGSRLLFRTSKLKTICVKSQSASFDNNPNQLIAVILSEFHLQSKPAKALGGGWYEYEIVHVGGKNVAVK